MITEEKKKAMEEMARKLGHVRQELRPPALGEVGRGLGQILHQLSQLQRLHMTGQVAPGQGPGVGELVDAVEHLIIAVEGDLGGLALSGLLRQPVQGHPHPKTPY